MRKLVAHTRQKLIFLTALMPLWLIGCATPLHKQVASIKPMMDKYDVLETAGSPSHTSYEKDHHIWVYRYPVNHDMKATQVIFRNNYVVSIKPYVLRPDKKRVAMDSSTFLEYEKKVLERRKSNFIDLEE